MYTRTSLLLGVLMLAPMYAQPPAANQTPTIKGSAEEVLLDVVVRDKKGKAITDLTPADIEILDDGARQTIQGFRRVEGREAISAGATTALDPLRQIRLVTLVFERLGPESRRFARAAALDLIKTSQAQNVFFAVMTIDTQLNVIQQFTADRERLRKGIERATSGAYTEFASDTSRIKDELRRIVGPSHDGRGIQEQAADAAHPPATLAGAANPNAASFIDAKVAQVMLDMLQFNQAIGSDEAARLSIFALTGMIRGEASLPGRKTVIHFSEGLRIPTNMDVPFRSLLSAANRSNVTFYAVDARGLLTQGENKSAADELAGAARNSREQALGSGREAVTKEQVTVADRAEESMRANLQTALQDLSESTGGFFIGNTNDVRGLLRRVNEEINSYYEITYRPGIENYDGRFRKISVRLLKGEGRLSTRNGYFALPALEGASAALMPYEVPLLKAVGASPLPKDVDFRTAILRFQQDKDGMKAALVIEVPFKSVAFVENPAKNTFGLHLSLLALLKNAKGEVLRKFDRDLPLEYPLDKMAEAKLANFQYNEPFSIPPGRYTVEAAVMDRNGGKIGARRVSVIAPVKTGGVGISSLSLVRRFEPKAKGLEPDYPFQYQGGRITPALADTVAAVKGGSLSIFFVVYPDPAVTDKPKAALEFLQDGKQVAKLDVDLPAVDASGRIPFVVSAPADAMPPGAYEVHVVVKQGATAAEDRTFVTVEAAPQP